MDTDIILFILVGLVGTNVTNNKMIFFLRFVLLLHTVSQVRCDLMRLKPKRLTMLDFF